ncbi:hypothetical protein BDV93DRAFT_57155 [Ceratobasidium sp. AG-I]|nr:hypothetical protein BDV93DRAFT_57155 [Ceratobasidium sp. AG-I]
MWETPGEPSGHSHESIWVGDESRQPGVGASFAWRRVLKPGGLGPHGALAAGWWAGDGGGGVLVLYARWADEGSEIGLIWGNWRSRSGQKRRWVAFQTGVRHQCFGSRCIIIPSLPRQKSSSSPPAPALAPSASVLSGCFLHYSVIISALYLICSP